MNPRGIPVISISIGNGTASKIFRIGDTMKNISDGSTTEPFTGVLKGIQLEPHINRVNNSHAAYDNIATFGYTSPDCALASISAEDYDVEKIVLMDEQGKYRVIDVHDISTLSIYDSDAEEWEALTEEALIQYINLISSDIVTVVSVDSETNTINATIDTIENLDLGTNLIQLFVTLNDQVGDLTDVTYASEKGSYVLVLEDETTYDPFKKGVLDSMPINNNEATSATLTANGKSGGQLVYTLNVKYYNEEDVVAKIGEAVYSSIENAIAAAKPGDTISLMKSVTVDNTKVSGAATNGLFTIPAGVTFDGQNNVITANAETWVGDTIQNHVFVCSSGNAKIMNVTVEGHAKAKSAVCCFGNGTVVTLENVTAKNFGNIGIQIAGANVTMTNVNTSGNAWGGINVDKGSDGSIPVVVFNSGVLSENVELYTELVDQDVITATGLTEIIGYGTTLKGFKFYTSDVTKLGVATGTVNGKTSVFETVSDASILADGSAVTLLKNVTEDVVFAEDANLELNLGGHNITGVASHAITNNGTLKITNNGTVDAVTHNCAALMNNGVCNVQGGHFTRSLEAGNATDNGGNSYYTILNHGEMELGSAVEVENAGQFSSNISNGWYDSTGKTEKNDTCKLTVNGAQITGGKYCLKNDELGDMTINSGLFTNNHNSTVALNWHKMTVAGGQFASTTCGAIQNGTYGLGVGKVVVIDGVFDCVAPVFTEVSGYPSDDYTVTGGTYRAANAVPAAYIPEGYEFVDLGEGNYTVQEKSAEETAKEEIDNIIDNIQSDNVTITPDPEQENVYSIVTNDASLATTNLFDQMAALEGMSTIVVTDGVSTATYTAGGDLETFKAEVDAMLPTKVDDPEVVLTMTVTVQ